MTTTTASAMPADLEQLVVTTMPVVTHEVNALLSRMPAHVQRQDLISAGHLALVRAARAYDPSTNVPFARYAALRVRGALIDELRSMDWISRGARTRAKTVVQAADVLSSTLGRTPTREEVAQATGMAVDQVTAARDIAQTRLLSIDAIVTEEAYDPVDDALLPEDVAIQGERLEYLRAAVTSLPENLRVVVEGLFFHDRTCADVADELGVTQSRISQMRSQALSMLRDGMNTHLDPHLVEKSDRPGGVADRRRQEYFAEVAARAARAARGPLVGFVPTQASAVRAPEALVAAG
ncbi:sigma-70 family RNA polymerase sigma factor [Cellulomonas oligotrophica]|uniref:RNA polymerase sigma factor for flagellar operon FliA n=1 Tax=Cellulomonas oligotrophica TaxID=931536 RepID=A0A7Y9FE88_9CELL|nr:sigma-70 family RNA polymerase sigma factor [Cellulomonas oligotrophica]NYD85733.1 RNA polymerase sigma factor for flagellar operon FliA [Cellulomonas oligotrophica]GIG31260.1 hypothetical protein Col01nite_04190 [Cellulomonas oligotrophica]